MSELMLNLKIWLLEMGGIEAVHQTNIDRTHLKKVESGDTLKEMWLMEPRFCRVFQLLVWQGGAWCDELSK